MLRTIITRTFLITMLSLAALGQEPMPTPSADATRQIDQLQEQIDLLKKQKEYEKAKSDLANQRLNEILAAAKPLGEIKGEKNQTTLTVPTIVNPESAALSYKALAELSSQIEKVIHPVAHQYAGIVIYNEADFLGLAKYRVYHSQSESAIGNYKAWRKRLEEFARQNSNDKIEQNGGFKTRVFDPLRTAVSIPNLATGIAGSVGELLSLFRTETFISESGNTVDEASLGTAMANELMKGNPNLKVFYPAAFVPEYDLDAEGKDSILLRVSDINMAYADVSEFLARCKDIPQAVRNNPPLRDIIADGEEISSHLKWLAVVHEKVGGRNTRDDGDADTGGSGASDLRQLIRAEKLDRFMRQGASTLGSATGPRVGILKLRSLASGGSRRETRNLFFGNHITYSGSVTLEVLLFEVDGTLRTSEIFSLHTGFRKLKTNKK